MIRILLLGSEMSPASPEDVVQIHYLSRLDRGGVCRIEVRTPGRLLDSYDVTKRTAEAIGRCLQKRCTVPLQLAFAGLGHPTLGPNPIRNELIRIRDRYRRWT